MADKVVMNIIIRVDQIEESPSSLHLLHLSRLISRRRCAELCVVCLAAPASVLDVVQHGVGELVKNMVSIGDEISVGLIQNGGSEYARRICQYVLQRKVWIQLICLG